MHSIARKTHYTALNNPPLCNSSSLRLVKLLPSYQRSAVRSCAFDGDRRTLLSGLVLGGLDSLFGPQMSKPGGLESFFNPFTSKPEAEVAPEASPFSSVRIPAKALESLMRTVAANKPQTTPKEAFPHLSLSL